MSKGLKSLARLLDELPFAPTVAILFGLAAGILVLATPGWLFERTFTMSGLPPMVTAAASLGKGAQVTAAILAAAGTAGIFRLLLGWAGLLTRPKAPRSRGHRIEPFYKPQGDEAEILAIANDASAASDHWAPANTPAAFAQRLGQQVPEAEPFESDERQESLAEGRRALLPGDIAGQSDLGRGSQLLH